MSNKPFRYFAKLSSHWHEDAYKKKWFAAPPTVPKSVTGLAKSTAEPLTDFKLDPPASPNDPSPARESYGEVGHG